MLEIASMAPQVYLTVAIFSRLVTDSFLLKFYYSQLFLSRIVTILLKTDQQLWYNLTPYNWNKVCF